MNIILVCNWQNFRITNSVNAFCVHCCGGGVANGNTVNWPITFTRYRYKNRLCIYSSLRWQALVTDSLAKYTGVILLRKKLFSHVDLVTWHPGTHCVSDKSSKADILSRQSNISRLLKKMGRRCWTLRLLLLVLCQILVDISQAGSSHADKTIRIGYLVEKKARAGAINVAIEQAQMDGYLRDYNFR